jgi:peroxiredoxin
MPLDTTVRLQRVRAVTVRGLLSMACLGASTAMGQTAPPPTISFSATGTVVDSAAIRLSPGDYDWRLQRLDGTTLTLAAFRGRVVFLHVWATWCRPCVEELASIQSLRDSLLTDSIEFVLVSPERREPVQALVHRRGMAMPMYIESTPAPAVLGLTSLPSTYLIAPDGRIALIRRGTAKWDTEALREYLRALKHYVQ